MNPLTAILQKELESHDLARVENDQDQKFLAACLVIKVLEYQLEQALKS